MQQNSVMLIRLPRRISAVNSENSNNSENVKRSSDNQKYSPIVAKLASMKDKHSLLKLAPVARKVKVKVNITRHLPMAMQAQRKTLINKGVRKGRVLGLNPPPLELDILQKFIAFARRLGVFAYFCLLICRLNANTTE